MLCDHSWLFCPSAFPQGQCEQQPPSLFCRNLKLPQTYFLLEVNRPTVICSEEHGGAPVASGDYGSWGPCWGYWAPLSTQGCRDTWQHRGHPKCTEGLTRLQESRSWNAAVKAARVLSQHRGGSSRGYSRYQKLRSLCETHGGPTGEPWGKVNQKQSLKAVSRLLQGRDRVGSPCPQLLCLGSQTLSLHRTGWSSRGWRHPKMPRKSDSLHSRPQTCPVSPGHERLAKWVDMSRTWRNLRTDSQRQQLLKSWDDRGQWCSLCFKWKERRNWKYLQGTGNHKIFNTWGTLTKLAKFDHMLSHRKSPQVSKNHNHTDNDAVWGLS